MQHLLEKWRFVIVWICAIFLVVGFAVTEFPLKASLTQGSSQLAQIIASETGLLRKWQQSGSLRHSLGYGSRGSEVALLQGMLAQDPGIYPERKVTGRYGDLTARAVVRFQGEYGIPQTGIIDNTTQNMLNDIFLGLLCPKSPAIYPEFLMKKVSAMSPLPPDYVPPSLLNVAGTVRTSGVICLRADVAPHLVRLFADAERDGVLFMVNSGYRKPEIQKYIYDVAVQAEGAAALREIARPGLSEHQLGSTVDLTDASIGFAGTDAGFATGAGGVWLKGRAHLYGFIMSYPDGKQEQTGFKYEPWHWRYVGTEAATRLHESNLTYNEADFDMNPSPLTALHI